MSATMYWRPTPHDPRGHVILPPLHSLLARAWLGQDGTLGTGPYTVSACAPSSTSNCAYLQGLVDAGLDGAQELLDAIGKHDSVDIWIDR